MPPLPGGPGTARTTGGQAARQGAHGWGGDAKPGCDMPCGAMGGCGKGALLRPCCAPDAAVQDAIETADAAQTNARALELRDVTETAWPAGPLRAAQCKRLGFPLLNPAAGAGAAYMCTIAAPLMWHVVTLCSVITDGNRALR